MHPRQSRFRGTSVVVVTEDKSRALEVKKESSGSGSVVVCSGSVVVRSVARGSGGKR